MNLRLVETPDLPDDACSRCGHVHTADDRCHLAYARDYCPICGTAATIGTDG